MSCSDVIHIPPPIFSMIFFVIARPIPVPENSSLLIGYRVIRKKYKRKTEGTDAGSRMSAPAF